MARGRGRSGGRGGGTRSSGITVQIEGLDRLREQLADLTPTIRAAGFKALQESAEAIRADASAGVRVRSGNLRNSAKARFHNNQLRAEIGWWDPDDFYAILHEFGTRRIRARPVLGPAAASERSKIAARIQAEVRRALS
ncbi:HK97-gp10 family putative phage morphogenesis protein [Streptomyces sp. NPDC006296]|uniref:HK97-gp10 family putative phage morphogenesis protein n=1 Tax=Streptomyces sp. NPDC006296 TaxID=3156746 RepID=UPI0033A7D8B6